MEQTTLKHFVFRYSLKNGLGKVPLVIGSAKKLGNTLLCDEILIITERVKRLEENGLVIKN